ncbi:MAG: NAD(P)-binding domain-containing protein [Albidovulum sp.]|uniref:NAD(P)-binding domain-containing protein n=1 Tax=Albidovulum sp. TaxID=1872424 RepID=UPI003CAAE96B
MTDGIGIAGSGRAGSAFLSRLRTSGLNVSAVGIPDDAEETDPAAFAASLRTLIAVPRDIGELEALLFSTRRLAETAPFLERIVIAATLSPRYIRALRGRIRSSVTLIDAPYSGTLRTAEMGRIRFFVGGDEETIVDLRSIFDTLGHRTIRMGDFGTATAAKTLNDLLTASSTALTRIALDWAEAQGIDDERIFDLTEAALGPGLLSAGLDQVQNDRTVPCGSDALTALVENVEIALDLACSEAHLRPPRTMISPVRGQRMRALH